MKQVLEKRIKQSLVMSLFVVTTYWGFSQQEPTLSQYMLSTYDYNAGYAGLSNTLNATIFYRQQWIGMRGAVSAETGKKSSLSPYNAHAIAEMPIKFLHGGIGLEVSTTTAAQFSDVFIKVGYAYHLQTSFGVIGMGVRAQFCNKTIDWASFTPEQSSDPVITGKTKENNSAFLADAGIGFYLKGNLNYNVGIAFNNIIASRKEDIGFSTMRNMVLSGGYSFTFPDMPKVEFSPVTRLTFILPGNDGRQKYYTGVYWDLSLLATFNRQFWTGLSYRMKDAVSVLAGFNFRQLQIGVSYDISTTKLIKVSAIGGSLEISVRYAFSIETDKYNPSYKNSRYL
ncbi:MAG: PorP/SprF family type IX secretion system membrane protein [Bacteroidales bacterium]|nr:PorP/SprF family type IX secretion system membrane protein [Bacteroidales bacterium]